MSRGLHLLVFRERGRLLGEGGEAEPDEVEVGDCLDCRMRLRLGVGKGVEGEVKLLVWLSGKTVSWKTLLMRKGRRKVAMKRMKRRAKSKTRMRKKLGLSEGVLRNEDVVEREVEQGDEEGGGSPAQIRLPRL
jgi:hypothetical protein